MAQQQHPSRDRFGGFLNATGTDIRSITHDFALIWLLQRANGQGDGVLAKFGHSNCSQRISRNIGLFFQPGGPLDAFQQVCADVLQCHVHRAETLVREIYGRDHS